MVNSRKEAMVLAGEEKSSWSTICTGTTESAAKKALDAFHKQAGIPLSTQAYVSAVSVMAITISGPPTTTKRFFESGLLTPTQRVSIPVYAPYHAEHLYSDADINKVIGDLAEKLQARRPASMVHSAVTGKAIDAESTLDLVKAALSSMLQKAVRWDHLLEETVSQMTAKKASTKIFAIGVSNVANSLVSALKAGGQTDVSTTDYTSWADVEERAFGRTQNDKIAIVGMAGRYPNAASHEALWDLLMKGLDVHRRIPADRFDADAHCVRQGQEQVSQPLRLLHRRAWSFRPALLQHVSS
jgi:hypothetical protein